MDNQLELGFDFERKVREKDYVFPNILFPILRVTYPTLVMADLVEAYPMKRCVHGTLTDSEIIFSDQ